MGNETRLHREAQQHSTVVERSDQVDFNLQLSIGLKLNFYSLVRHPECKTYQSDVLDVFRTSDDARESRESFNNKFFRRTRRRHFASSLNKLSYENLQFFHI